MRGPTLPVVIAASLAAGCAAFGRGGGGPTATAEIRPFSGQRASGTARFTETAAGRVRVEIEARGLTPGEHGLHVHDKGDCSTTAASGPHFDPAATGKHGFPGDPADAHHAGDLPNLVADASGATRLSWETSNLTVSPGPRSIAGRALVIHAKPDDYRTDPAGDSGDRVACGVIVSTR